MAAEQDVAAYHHQTVMAGLETTLKLPCSFGHSFVLTLSGLAVQIGSLTLIVTNISSNKLDIFYSYWDLFRYYI